MSPKWETIFIFTLLLPSPPPPLHQLPKKKLFMQWRELPNESCLQRHQTIWRQIKYSLIPLLTNNSVLIRYYHSFHFLSPLVSTIADLTSTRKAPERQYPSFEKIQVNEIWQESSLHPETSQLNDSLAIFVRLRSLCFTKNSEPFSRHYILYVWDKNKICFYVN